MWRHVVQGPGLSQGQCIKNLQQKNLRTEHEVGKYEIIQHLIFPAILSFSTWLRVGTKRLLWSPDNVNLLQPWERSRILGICEVKWWYSTPFFGRGLVANGGKGPVVSQVSWCSWNSSKTISANKNWKYLNYKANWLCIGTHHFMLTQGLPIERYQIGLKRSLVIETWDVVFPPVFGHYSCEPRKKKLLLSIILVV